MDHIIHPFFCEQPDDPYQIAINRASGLSLFDDDNEVLAAGGVFSGEDVGLARHLVETGCNCAASGASESWIRNAVVDD